MNENRKMTGKPGLFFTFILPSEDLHPFMKMNIISISRVIMRSAFFITVVGLLFADCQKEINSGETSLPFEITPDTTNINPGIIDEASGIADSKKNPGYLWVQQDSGNPPELYLLSYNGNVFKKIHIKGAINRDWEDITIGSGPAPGTNYIYVAETGDNTASYPDYAIYRMPEPSLTEDTIYTWEKITFQYPDGSHDVEAILTDDDTNDIYLVTKRDSVSKIFRLPYPQNIGTTNMALEEGTMKISGACSAAISPDGRELLIKNYTNVYYWKRENGESIIQALKRIPVTLGYVLEPQGEALCFKNDNSGFYTLSEKPFFANFVSLNFYKRK
ncbi:MAG TPA: hypothetical protein PKC72_11130 [Chitinophagaceae bacterium]|nr:hypothetical protein [Chitinophagaceae bacterium]